MKTTPPIARWLLLPTFLMLISPIYAPALTPVREGSSSPSSSPSIANATTSNPILISNPVNASVGVVPPPIFMEGEHPKLDVKLPLNISTVSTEAPHVQPVTSSVHARKGVSIEDIKVPLVKIESNNTDVKPPTKPEAKSTTVVSSTTTKKPIPKKPLITSGADEISPIPPVPIVVAKEKTSNAPSSSPTSEIAVEPKVEVTKAESAQPASEYSKLPEAPRYEVQEDPSFFQSYFHSVPSKEPRFILPIVITIFAVPLIALVGYQAIRRGKEAWRNRHYRRMDYLIDGMYND
ncbi:uncharacterized protein LOC143915200 [Arctopsyche grandis]|uniref:uncharacterized protein LOC143915200 n=1 Tax=Arctopsyche grandis TaxID=121162 RepID=UPI00406D7490